VGGDRKFEERRAAARSDNRTAFELDERGWERFAATLDRPPRVPAGLRELFSRPSVFESPSK
jgi:uncharacterized protein (DUF1778 family)